MKVKDVMHRGVAWVGPETSIKQLAQMMRDEDIGSIPIGENDRLVGMVTDRDLAVRLLAEGRDPGRTKVREVMTPEVRYVFEDEDVSHVADNMAEQQVRRMPVVNRDKRLVGVVSVGDLAQGKDPQLAGRALQGASRKGGRHMQTAAE